ncbi:hypothetical protein SPHV1_70005 [Novosphingobium sp. KN65.2]|nr:hypothetical protein SPHV1_70005 [Novosphingobium sp. KN65.2]
MHLSELEQRVMRGSEGYRDRRRLPHIQAFGHGIGVVFGHCEKLGMAAVPVEADDLVTFLEARDLGADRKDGARSLVPGYERRLGRRRHQPVEQVAAFDRNPFDRDEHGLGADLRIGQVAILHDLRPAVFEVVDCLHRRDVRSLAGPLRSGRACRCLGLRRGMEGRGIVVVGLDFAAFAVAELEDLADFRRRKVRVGEADRKDGYGIVLARGRLHDVEAGHVAHAHDFRIEVLQGVLAAIGPGHRQAVRLVGDEVVGEHRGGRLPVTDTGGGIKIVDEIDHFLGGHAHGLILLFHLSDCVQTRGCEPSVWDSSGRPALFRRNLLQMEGVVDLAIPLASRCGFGRLSRNDGKG